MNDARFQELLEHYLDGALPEAEAQELSAELDASPVRLKQLHAHAAINTLLLLQARPSVEMTQTVQAALLNDDEKKALVNNVVRRLRRPASRFKLLLSAAALVLVCVSAYFVWPRSEDLSFAITNADGAIEMQTGASNEPGKSTWVALSSLARTTNSNWRWQKGSALRVNHGVGTITLVNSGVIQLNAATVLEAGAMDPPAVLLKSGEIFCDIIHAPAAESVRFVVHAGNAEVRVKGTKFGVDLNSGAVDVAVFEGTVECADKQAQTRVAAGNMLTIPVLPAAHVTRSISPESLAHWAWAGANSAIASLEANLWHRSKGAGLPGASELSSETTVSPISSMGVDGEGRLYAVFPKQGVYRSADKGENWENVTKGLSLPQAAGQSTLGVSPSGELIASFPSGREGDKSPACFVRARTTDNWIQATVKGGLWNGFKTFCINAQHELLGGNEARGEIYRSTDNGRSFELLSSLPNSSGIDCLGLNPVNGVVIAGTGLNGYFRSKDDGVHWEPIEGQNDNEISRTISISLCFNRLGDAIFSELPGKERFIPKIFKPNDPRAHHYSNFPAEIEFVSSLITSPDGVMYVSDKGKTIYCSTDNGESWKRITSDTTNDLTHRWAVDSNGTLFVATSSGNVAWFKTAKAPEQK